MATAPRDWLVNAKHFGRVRVTKWKAPGPGAREQAGLAAAYWQHLFVIEAEAARHEESLTWAAIAERAGIDAGTLGKVVRGHRPMTLALMLGLAQVLERVDLLPAPLELADLLPGS